MATKVTVFGQDEPKKELKKIEFVYSIDEIGDKERINVNPSKYDNIVFLGRYNMSKGFDIMLAWNNGCRTRGLFLGHFNDGVV